MVNLWALTRNENRINYQRRPFDIFYRWKDYILLYIRDYIILYIYACVIGNHNISWYKCKCKSYDCYLYSSFKRQLVKQKFKIWKFSRSIEDK